VKALQKKLNY